ncbi:hypothetical protein FCL40_08785 [Ferrimonas sediminicola]|uniref:Uncharacterized protein n=1 Tax=Ferrimonas sediminicola TaxID=2569538 RepID=A0A4U1BEW5_9GAMM|nr:hypothetical protein [Ferrimonas sediminicola]TKB49418.1 hypothetical protein FCL40_08785 [Ferrimonas sediminicola]
MAKKHSHIPERQFWIQRLGKSSLRALHVLGIIGASGGFFYEVEKALWLPWWILAMSTGLILMAWEVIRSPLWLVQMKGVLTLTKVVLVALCYPLSQFKVPLFCLVALISVVTSHGPAGLRHYSVVHRRRIDGPKEIKG